MSDLVFALGTLAVLLGWWGLARWTAGEEEALARALGLALVPAGRVERRAERGQQHQRLFAAGTLAGRPVELWVRSWRRGGRAGPGSSISTLLVLPLAAGARATSLRVEPRARALILDAWFGPAAEVTTDDPDFDSAFRLSATDRPAATALLDVELRRALSAWHQRFVGSAGAGVAHRLADLAAGAVLEVEPGRILWAVRGSPRPALAEQLRAALPLLEGLARRLEAAAGRSE